MLDNLRWQAASHSNASQDLWAFFFVVVDGNALWNEKNPSHFSLLEALLNPLPLTYLLETVKKLLNHANW